MDATIVVHIEEDLLNEHGSRTYLPREQETIRHVSEALNVLRGTFFSRPLNVAIKHGGSIGFKLLKLRVWSELSEKWEVLLHPHGEEYDERRGWLEKPCKSEDVRLGYAALKASTEVEPTGIVFGDWLITREGLEAAKSLGIKRDASYVPYKNGDFFVIKPPFYFESVLEVPVTSNGAHPLNPVGKLFDLKFLASLLKKHKGEDGLLHIAFHSYDLFNFYKRVNNFQLARERLRRLRAMLKLLDKYDVEVKSLSQVHDKYTLRVARFNVPSWTRWIWRAFSLVEKVSLLPLW
ncbi:MAG: hypothetical protein QW186_05190 [Candidatus Bathyarchaeia archaeon]